MYRKLRNIDLFPLSLEMMGKRCLNKNNGATTNNITEKRANLTNPFEAIRSESVNQSGLESTALNEYLKNKERMNPHAHNVYHHQSKDGENIVVEFEELPKQNAYCSVAPVHFFSETKIELERQQLRKFIKFNFSDEDIWTRGLFKAEVQQLASHLSDSRASKTTSCFFAQSVVNALCPRNITVNIQKQAQSKTPNSGSYMLIAKGSYQPPVLVETNYCDSASNDKPVLLLGKGITFHSLAQKKTHDASRATITEVTKAIKVNQNLAVNIPEETAPDKCKPSCTSHPLGDNFTQLSDKEFAAQANDKEVTEDTTDPFTSTQNTSETTSEDKKKVPLLENTSDNGFINDEDKTLPHAHVLWQHHHKHYNRLWRFPLWDFYCKIAKIIRSLTRNPK